MKIIICKSKRELMVYDGSTLFLRTGIQLGFGADEGPKRREGDGRTPEGTYRISSKNPKSRFHLSLGISYPGIHDAEKALADGRIDRTVYEAVCASPERPPWDTPLGGFIMIHGQKSPPEEGDWTAGCIAVSNDAMDAIYHIIGIGDEVEILP